MSPYYRGEWSTLYLGDCREVCAELPRNSVDLLVTDPPYGVKWRSNRRSDKFGNIVGDDGTLDVPGVLGEIVARLLPKRRHVYVFGYSPETLAGSLKLGGTAWLVWDKKQLGPGDLEIPWAPAWEQITFGVHTPSAAERRQGYGRFAARLRQSSVVTFPRSTGARVQRHPTEKPVALMRALVESSSLSGETVLDPFAGSGSTLVAAVAAGRRAVGVECDEKYAEVAAARLEVAERLAREVSAL